MNDTGIIKAIRRDVMWPTALDWFRADVKNIAILHEAYHSI